MLVPVHRKHGLCHCSLVEVVDSLAMADYLRTSSAIPGALPVAHSILNLTLMCFDCPVCRGRVLPWGIHDRRKERRKARRLVVWERLGNRLPLLASGWDVRKGVSIDMQELDLGCRSGIGSLTAESSCCNNRWQP